jgi:hypothetical protein
MGMLQLTTWNVGFVNIVVNMKMGSVEFADDFALSNLQK